MAREQRVQHATQKIDRRSLVSRAGEDIRIQPQHTNTIRRGRENGGAVAHGFEPLERHIRRLRAQLPRAGHAGLQHLFSRRRDLQHLHRSLRLRHVTAARQRGHHGQPAALTLLTRGQIPAAAHIRKDEMHRPVRPAALDAVLQVDEEAPVRVRLHLRLRIKVLLRMHHHLRTDRRQRILDVGSRELVIIRCRRRRCRAIHLPPRLQRLKLQQQRAAQQRQDRQHLLRCDGAKDRAFR